jgi:hypothetical protein
MNKKKQSTLLQSWCTSATNKPKPATSSLFSSVTQNNRGKKDDVIEINDFSDDDNKLLFDALDDKSSSFDSSHQPQIKATKNDQQSQLASCSSKPTGSECFDHKIDVKSTNEWPELDAFDDDLMDNDTEAQSTDCNDNYVDAVPGFDCAAGRLWIYPTNYPLRDYQFNIVQQALYKNTLVVLPTGLGKTFIASVVMYNYYRWYPSGKIVFMAPTKPLVAQQIEACYSVMGIPQEDMMEMTGRWHC